MNLKHTRGLVDFTSLDLIPDSRVGVYCSTMYINDVDPLKNIN